MGNYALIKLNVIQNVCIAEYFNVCKIAQNTNMNDVVCIDNLPVEAGDTWDGKDFFRNGIKLEKTPTLETSIKLLGIENTDRDLEIISLDQKIAALTLRVIALGG